MRKMLVKRLTDTSIVPRYQTEGAAGLDLHVDLPQEFQECGDFLAPGERKLFKTGLAMVLPQGYVGQICPRSGLALKHGITVVNSPGIIDEDYRGEIGIILLNTSDEMFAIKQGDRIAQMVLVRYDQFDIVVKDRLSDTVRGEGGFGHSGK